MKLTTDTIFPTLTDISFLPQWKTATVNQLKPIINLKNFHFTLILLIAPFCHATHNVTFQAIENYTNKPQPYSYIDYQSFESLSKHANELFSTEQYDEAVAFYKQAIALNPTCAQVFFNLGQALYYAKKYPEALYAYKKTIQCKNDHYRAYVQIAKVMIDVKQSSDAIDPLKKALTI